MRKDKHLAPYIVQHTESLHHALLKLNENKSRIIFVVSSYGELMGSLTDGDIRRWLTEVDSIDLTVTVEAVMNKDCFHLTIEATNTEIEEQLSERLLAIPLLDSSQRVIAISLRNRGGFQFGERIISEEMPCYVIAEIGNNHQGDIQLAKELVMLAKQAGADCAKFQMRNLDQLYKKATSDDLGAEYTKDLLNKFSLTNAEMVEVFDYCKELNLEPLCTPWDLDSLAALEEYGMKGYKVASADFTNLELLEALCRTEKPLICSTGMSTEAEIKQSVNFLNKHNSSYALLHCNSTYPTPFKDVNLAYLKRLKEQTDSIVGYSGHERGISIPLAAVTLGAKIVEKHFTIDKGFEGSDHKVSLLPEEFSVMVKQIREIEEAIGSAAERELTQGEMLNRENLAKSLVAKSTIKKGQKITRDMITIQSPGQGLQPNLLERLVGRTANRDVPLGDFFYDSDLKDNAIIARNYTFDRPFGIPARYHDYTTLASKSNLDFVEFHLSYKDMELNLEDFFDGEQSIGFAVHSPELFANDHILDLATSEPSYRLRSISELQKVVSITRELKKYFPKTELPVIVVNAGGFDSNGFVSKENKADMYRLVGEALQQLDSEGVTIAIQTMPPFPWHFGGQSYHNLFLDADEIVEFCITYGTTICLDVSHTQMACTYYDWDLINFVNKVGPYISHMHIVDALGVDGEGIEVGKGDVNFSQLGKALSYTANNIQFIPEVWQGHKNNGEGFWLALEYLEKEFKTEISNN